MASEFFKLASENALRAGYAQGRYDLAHPDQPAQEAYIQNFGPPPMDPAKKDMLTGGAIGGGLGAMVGAGIEGDRLIGPYREQAKMVTDYAGRGTKLEKVLLKDLRGKDMGLNVLGRLGKAALIGLPIGAIAGAMYYKNRGERKRSQMAALQASPVMHNNDNQAIMEMAK